MIAQAFELLAALEARGIEAFLGKDGSVRLRPRVLISEADRAAVRAALPAVRVVLALGTEAVERRVDAMRALRARGVAGLVAVEGAAWARGTCVSCGAALPAPARVGRCLPCAIAWRLVAGVPADVWTFGETEGGQHAGQ